MFRSLNRRFAATMVLPATVAAFTVAATLVSSTAPPPVAELGPIVHVASQSIDRNIVANFNSGSATSWANTYDSVIRQIRARVSRGTLREGVIDQTNTEDYFGVHFQAGTGTAQATVVFNAANLYVVGYYNHALNTYVRMGLGPHNPVGAAHVREDFLRRGDYGYLERQAGVSRRDLPLGMGALNGAIITLRTPRALGTAPISRTDEQAAAIVTIIQMFAEGARFDFASYNIGESVRRGREFTAGTNIRVSPTGNTNNGPEPTALVTLMDFETVWAQLSAYLRDFLQHASRAFRFAVTETLVFVTVQAVANQLAVAHGKG